MSSSTRILPLRTPRKTVHWLKEHKVKFICKEEWKSYSPDLASMDYWINGIFKRILKSRIAKNSKQLARIIRSEWKEFPLCTIRKALLSSKKHVVLMLEKQGFQIKQDLVHSANKRNFLWRGRNVIEVHVLCK